MRGCCETILLTALIAAACHDGSAVSTARSEASPSREVVQALAVWASGAAVIPAPPTEDMPGEFVPWLERPLAPFRDFDGDVREFLASPRLANAVQFGCTPDLWGAEEWVTSGLDSEDPLVRLRALVVLVQVRAPRSTAKQWAVLNELGMGARAAEFAPVIDRIRAVFDPRILDAALIHEPLAGGYSAPAAYQWTIRAVGVVQHRPALARLVALSRSNSLPISLAAASSLQEFEGPDADAALAECLCGWRYNASLVAAGALLVRDRELLRRTLLASQPPREMLCYKGTLLAELDDPRSVPILCETVPDRAIMDREMFNAIERLALPEHLAAIEALPGRVREEQRDRAMELVERVRSRVGRPSQPFVRPTWLETK